MTTVAYSDGVMAWDSKLTSDHMSYGLKGLKDVDAGVIVAGCGDAYAMFAMINWLLTGKEGDPPRCSREDDFALLLLWKDGLLESMDRRGRLMPLNPREQYAIGSGGMAAKAAMLCGATAEGAVEIAGKCDPYTGGAVVAASW